MYHSHFSSIQDIVIIIVFDIINNKYIICIHVTLVVNKHILQYIVNKDNNIANIKMSDMANTPVFVIHA